MKKLLPILFCTVLFTGCEKYEFGYIESLAGTAWRTDFSGNHYYILDFKKSSLTWIVYDEGKSSTNTGLTWSCSSDGSLYVYWNKFSGSGPYMTGTFDKYKGTLVVDGNRYKLINKP